MSSETPIKPAKPTQSTEILDLSVYTQQQFFDPEAYKKAWDFATLAHEGQTYGGMLENQRVPYQNHIASVAMEVIWALPSAATLSANFDSNLAAQCALLHDTLEDTSTTYTQLADLFGQRVADGVQALSKNGQLPKSEQMRDSLQRIYAQGPEICSVKMADRITNLYGPPWYWDIPKRRSYQAEAQVIWDALHSQSLPALAARLQSKIAGYERFF